MNSKKSFNRKEKVYTILSKSYVVALVMLLAPLLNHLDRNFSFFFGLGIVWLILWVSGFNWSLFGFSKITGRTILRAVIFTMFLIVADTCITLIIEPIFGEPNLASLKGIKHDTVEYLVTLIIVWVFASFGEEFLFRGYYMKWLATLMGNKDWAWIASGIITSIYFGISHYYQGPAGMISIIMWSLMISAIFYKNRMNLGLVILIHGLHDTYGLTMIYLDMENPLAEFIKAYLSNFTFK